MRVSPPATVDQEAFQTWLEHPVTQWIFRALSAQAEAQRQAWVEASWGPTLSGDPGQAPPELLLELKTRADAFEAMRETNYERYCQVLGQSPVTE